MLPVPDDGRSDRKEQSDGQARTAKVTAAAKAKVPGGSIVRVETDANGNAAYEAHMVKADGTPVTVYVNKQYEVVGVQTGMPGPPARSNGASA